MLINVLVIANTYVVPFICQALCYILFMFYSVILNMLPNRYILHFTEEYTEAHRFTARPSHITSSGGTTNSINPVLKCVYYCAVQSTTALYARAEGWKSSRSSSREVHQACSSTCTQIRTAQLAGGISQPCTQQLVYISKT